MAIISTTEILDDPIKYWKFCDEFSIHQAACLILGHDPSDMAYFPRGYEAVKTALVIAVQREEFCFISIMEEYDSINERWIVGSVDVHKTKITRQDVIDFLKKRNHVDGFFITNEILGAGFLDSRHPCYATKLAAAVMVWEAVQSDEAVKQGSKSPKQAIDKWLRLNAAKYDLTKDDGSLNETGIEEVSKVANWKSTGGANKTPVKSKPPTPKASENKENISTDF